MCDRGAQDVVVLSRRGAKSPEAQTLINDLASQGITVKSVRCDVSKSDQVVSAVEDASHGKPLKGIVHSAVSYQDITFDKISIDRWHESLAAKVAGTRNLHEATLSLPLDFFITTTSIESVCALATQSAYTAANNFQDYFARYRRRCALPSSTVSFGFINDIGDLSTNSVTVDLFARNKIMTITEPQFLSMLEPAFLNNKLSHSAAQRQDPLSLAGYVTCLDPAAMAARKLDELEAGLPAGPEPRWYRDGRVSLILRAFNDAVRHAGDATAGALPVEADGKKAVLQLRREFDEAFANAEEGSEQQQQQQQRAKIVAFVTDAIVTAVAEMLFIERSGVNPARTVADHGVDSLIAAELRNWFLLALGLNISMLDLLDAHRSIGELAASIVDEKMQARDKKE